MKKPHSIVLRIVSHRGCRTEFVMLLNNQQLQGKVVRSMSKGKETWKTSFRGRSIDHFDPEWLCRRNSRIVTLGLDHPTMKQVKERHDAQEAAMLVKKQVAKAKRDAKKQAKMLDPLLDLMLDSNVKLAS